MSAMQYSFAKQRTVQRNFAGQKALQWNFAGQKAVQYNLAGQSVVDRVQCSEQSWWTAGSAMQVQCSFAG